MVILGGGAAGLMAAMTAGRRGRRVTVLEKNSEIGRKIRISGGGRCNFTNISESLHDSYHSSDGDGTFSSFALQKYPPRKFVQLVEAHGIPYHEKKLGQLFCDRSAQDIVDMLRSECQGAGVEIWTDTLVTGLSTVGQLVEQIRSPLMPGGAVTAESARIRQTPATARFKVTYERRSENGSDTQAASLLADAVIVASGGLSFARSCGATDLAHRVAGDLGLQVCGVKPGLVPFLVSEDDAWMRSLAGVSMPVRISIGQNSFVENVLFTHKGLSGPAVLQVSSFWDPSQEQHVLLDFAPDETEDHLFDWLSNFKEHFPGKQPRRVLPQRFPSRFATLFWAAKAAPTLGLRHSAKFEHVTLDMLQQLAHMLKNFMFSPVGTEGYPKAEVTCGGISTAELCAETMEVRRVPGLFYVGEAVDRTGWLGGYNFQWAWASGYVAGEVC